MKFRHLLTLLGAASVLLCPGSGYAVLGLFQDKPKEAPDATELTAQETKAVERYKQAQAEQTGGKFSKARDIYEEIVRLYPLTASAANSQFEIARCREKEGDPSKAFEAYQAFVDKYKQSDLFAEAIERQFELATLAMNGKTSTFFMLIPAKAQSSKVTDMFEKVATNAPHTRFAPLAIYNVGLLETKAGHPDSALVAFERVAEDYPKDDKAPEARKRMIEIYESRNSRNDAVVSHIQDQIDELGRLYPTDPEMGDYRAKSGQLEEREAEKAFNIGRFYEHKGNLRAAAIYYLDVPAGSQRYAAAHERLGALQAQDPNLVLPPSATKRKVEAPVDVVDNPKYVGPKPPSLEGQPKLKMRSSEADVLPIPVPGS